MSREGCLEVFDSLGLGGLLELIRLTTQIANIDRTPCFVEEIFSSYSCLQGLEAISEDVSPQYREGILVGLQQASRELSKMLAA